MTNLFSMVDLCSLNASFPLTRPSPLGRGSTFGRFWRESPLGGCRCAWKGGSCCGRGRPRSEELAWGRIAKYIIDDGELTKSVNNLSSAKSD